MLALLRAVGVTVAMPYVTRPVPPLGVPQIVSQAFWGGVWGIVFALVAPRFPRGTGYWTSAVLFGALALSLIAWFIVAPLKGLPVAGGGHPGAIATALLVNGAWGFGPRSCSCSFGRSWAKAASPYIRPHRRHGSGHAGAGPGSCSAARNAGLGSHASSSLSSRSRVML